VNCLGEDGVEGERIEILLSLGKANGFGQLDTRPFDDDHRHDSGEHAIIQAAIVGFDLAVFFLDNCVEFRVQEIGMDDEIRCEHPACGAEHDAAIGRAGHCAIVRQPRHHDLGGLLDVGVLVDEPRGVDLDEPRDECQAVVVPFDVDVCVVEPCG
jgi:hypothetical protein